MIRRHSAMGSSGNYMRNNLKPFWALVFIAMALISQAAPAAAKTIAAGSYHSLGIKADGTVVAWGYNGSGQCSVPGGLTGVVTVAAGGTHSLALKSDGTVVAWGYNVYGQCSVPAGAFIAVAAGGSHSLALKADGSVVAWGNNGYGQCNVPGGLTGVVAVAAGWHYSLALKSDGTVAGWGAPYYLPPAGLGGVVAVAAGGSSGWDHSLALKSDGTVVAWGFNIYGQCSVPGGLTGVVAVAAGGNHSLALKADGTVVAWGYNGYGQCNVPGSLTGVVAVAAGGTHSLALKADGTVVAWGYSVYGQCSVPAEVTFMLPNRPPLSNAGGNVTILSEDLAATTLLGAASDPDGDSLTYRWVEGETPLTSWERVQNGQAPLNLGSLPLLSLGQHNLTLEVSDGKVTANDPIVLTLGNSAPNPAPLGSGTYEVNTPVSLGGQVSDFDGDPLTYRWLEGTVDLTQGTVQGIKGGQPITLTPFLVSNLPVGDHELTLEVRDGLNAPVASSFKVSIIDTTAPTLTPVADKTILWPPNKMMVPITIWANAVDNSGLPVTLTATVSCNEPNEGFPYWTEPMIEQATGIITLQLQADRLGKGKGRMYTIGLTAMDAFGNIISTPVLVSVPHDQGTKR